MTTAPLASAATPERSSRAPLVEELEDPVTTETSPEDDAEDPDET